MYLDVKYHWRLSHMFNVLWQVSITFDPFSVVQVPIPKKKSVFNIIYMSLIAARKPVQVCARSSQSIDRNFLIVLIIFFYYIVRSLN